MALVRFRVSEMTPRQIESLQKWLPMLGTFVLIGISWGLLTAQVQQKADLSDLQRIESVINRLDAKVDALVRIECRRDPKDSICPYK